MKLRFLLLSAALLAFSSAPFSFSQDQGSPSPSSQPAPTAANPAPPSSQPAPTAATPTPPTSSQPAPTASAPSTQSSPASASPGGQSGTDTASPSDKDKDKPSAQTDQGSKPPGPVVEPADPAKVKHDGGKDDVDAIGNRKMGGRGLSNWYSIEGEIKMGKQYAMQVEASSKLINDPVITEYVNRIGQNL